MAGLGVEKLEKLMPEIVATASKVDIAPHVRDGYIMMFIIPCILKVGTSDRAQEGGRGRMLLSSRASLGPAARHPRRGSPG